MFRNHLFSQRNKATKRREGLKDVCGRGLCQTLRKGDRQCRGVRNPLPTMYGHHHNFHFILINTIINWERNQRIGSTSIVYPYPLIALGNPQGKNYFCIYHVTFVYDTKEARDVSVSCSCHPNNCQIRENNLLVIVCKFVYLLLFMFMFYICLCFNSFSSFLFVCLLLVVFRDISLNT